MKKIGIICAVDVELAPFLDIMEKHLINKRKMLDFHEGFVCGFPVVAVRCGVGKVNAAIAAQSIIDIYDVDAIIVSGVAGGMDKHLIIGDTVIATEICYHDLDAGILKDYHPYMSTPNFYPDKSMVELCTDILKTNPVKQAVYYGRIVTGDAFITTEGRSEINALFSPLCVDMESAAIAHVCFVNKIPFLAVRSVSDTEEKSGMGTFEENCLLAATASFNALNLKTFITKYYC